MSTMKPIFIHGHAGPNPWKVAIILEELSIAWEYKVYATPDLKKPPFTTEVNPNGFAPAIDDPNHDIKLWESGAIIEYILETYDTEHKLSFPSSALQDRAHMRQWAIFQCTFQGPSLSNAFYFVRNPNTEARKRFVDESIRVLGVLEGALQSSEYLVGNKCSAADLVLVPYIWSQPLILGADNVDMSKEYPNVNAWYEKLMQRESIKKIKGFRDLGLQGRQTKFTSP